MQAFKAWFKCDREYWNNKQRPNLFPITTLLVKLPKGPSVMTKTIGGWSCRRMHLVKVRYSVNKNFPLGVFPSLGIFFWQSPNCLSEWNLLESFRWSANFKVLTLPQGQISGMKVLHSLPCGISREHWFYQLICWTLVVQWSDTDWEL